MPAPTAKLPTTTHPFTGWNVPHLLAVQASARPDATFLVWRPVDGPRQEWTYAEFSADVERRAHVFRCRGLAAGEHVLLHLNNSPEFLVSYFALLLLGAIAVTTNTRSTAEELAYFASKCGARAAITERELAAAVVASGHPFEWVAIVDDSAPFLNDEGGVDRLRCARLPLDSASVQFTSGTTSRPKGVVFTHANLLWAARVSASHIGIGATHRTLVLAPLFHVNALFYSVMATLWAGGTVVLVPKFSRTRFWSTVLEEKVDWLSIQPFAVRALAPGHTPEHNLEFLGLGAADVDWIEGALRCPTIGWWGMTETISHGIVTVPGWRSRPMSMGRPAPEYEIKVVANDGTQVEPGPQGTRGRLWVRGIAGLSLFWEYLGDPEATAAAYDADGWFDTGDEVIAFDDGEILFGDRDKDIVRVGGENVSAAEVERVLMMHPDIDEAAVVARSDPMLDEVPVAFVIARGTTAIEEESVIAHCEKNLASFKIPRSVYLVDELPRSLLDKINKADLRARANARART